MTIAVTAATGQLGTLVIDSLLTRIPADQVVAVVRDASKAEALTAKGVDVRIADYDDSAALNEALKGIDKLLLISGSEIGKRAAQHVNVIDAAVAQGVGQLVYTSVPQVETSTLPVAPDHLSTEQYLAAASIDSVVIRYNWYTENYLAALEAAAATGTVLTSAGDGRVASAARADFAEAAAAVLTTDGPVKPVYELAGDVAWTHDDLAATLAEALGKPVAVAQVTPEQQTEILTGAGVDPGLVDFLVSTDASIKQGELALTTGDLSALIGRPTTPIADTFRNVA